MFQEVVNNSKHFAIGDIVCEIKSYKKCCVAKSDKRVRKLCEKW